MRLLSTIAFFASVLVCTAQERPTGTWTVLEYDQNGARAPADVVRKMKVIVQGERIIIQPRVVAEYKRAFDGTNKVDVNFSIEIDKTEEATYKLDPAKGRIDLVWRGVRGETKTTLGVYELDQDAMKICFALPGKNRPKKFPDGPKAGVVRLVLARDVK